MTLKCSDSDVAQWKRVRLITGRSVDQNHPSLLYKNNILPISRSLADRGGFKILWAKAPRQFKSDSRHIFNPFMFPRSKILIALLAG